MPITLAFARTCHKAQGISVGPTDANQIPNMFQCVVCDPGDRTREGNCPGLLYMCMSRATTFGDADGLNSAFYFNDQYEDTKSKAKLDESRVLRTTYKCGSFVEYDAVVKRNKWVEYLENGQDNRDKVMADMTREERQDVVHWAETATYTHEQLRDCIDRYCNSVQTRRVYY